MRRGCNWELNRRAANDYGLLPPETAIDPSEDGVSINAAIAMRATFNQDAPAVRRFFVRRFFDALVNLLTGGGNMTSGTNAEAWKPDRVTLARTC